MATRKKNQVRKTLVEAVMARDDVDRSEARETVAGLRVQYSSPREELLDALAERQAARAVPGEL